jgi:hypothetical protein
MERAQKQMGEKKKRRVREGEDVALVQCCCDGWRKSWAQAGTCQGEKEEGADD